MKITAGEVQLFCHLPPEDTDANGFNISSLAIDGEDNVYIVTKCKPTNNVYYKKLFVFDAKGNMKHQCSLQFLKRENHMRWVGHPIAITKDKKIIISGLFDEHTYVCDSSGELKCSFPTETCYTTLSISDENEIIAVGWIAKFVYIHTEEGDKKRKLEVPKGHKVYDVAFNHVTKEVIVLTETNDGRWISSYSTTGEKWQTVRSPLPGHLTSHPSGPVALVDDGLVLYI